MALTLSGSSDSEDLHKAVQIFKKISDYKDSASRAAVVQKVYEEVLQGEKEWKILEKERKEKNLSSKIKTGNTLLRHSGIKMRRVSSTFYRSPARGILW